MQVSAIIAAAGSGTRMGLETPKQFLDLLGKPMIAWSIEAFSRVQEVVELVVVAHPAYIEVCQQAVKDYAIGVEATVVEGGHTRQESVAKGLEASGKDVEWVAVHDAARPFIQPSQISSTIIMAREFGAAIAGVPIPDTVKEVQDNIIIRTLDRRHLVGAQTPQVCRKQDLVRAREQAEAQGLVVTDEAALLEFIGVTTAVAETSSLNFKVTTKADLVMARALAPILAEKGDLFHSQESEQ